MEVYFDCVGGELLYSYLGGNKGFYVFFDLGEHRVFVEVKYDDQ